MSEKPSEPFEAPSMKQPKPWKCGQTHNFPLPTPNDDPWTQLLKPLLEKDAERCKVWKDEVSNILIFAGLFSAVVTAFIIESYKSLRKDPVEVMLEYLVANRLGDQASPPLTTDSFSLPDSSSTRINTLWFLSLVLSLVTVLIGTIALQWVREHQRNYGELDPQVAFSLHRMQVESFERWLVPQTFTLLSLLLLAAVVLFLLGLVELLWLMNRAVGIWVGVAVALALFFVVFTTILPTFQAILLFLPIQVRRPRSPCPYKSPQAWAFHQLCSPIVRAVKHVFGEPSDKYSRIDAQNLMSDRTRDYWVDTLPHGTGILFRHDRRDSWLEHGVAWLYQRDFEYMAFDSNFDRSHHYQKLPIPLYDAVRGLLEAKETAFLTHTDYTDVDHAVGIILSTNEMQGRCGPYGRFLHRLSLGEPLEFGIPPEVVVNDVEALQDEASLRLFSRNSNFDNIPSGAEKRALAVCVRLTEWMYGQDESRTYERSRDPERYRPAQNLPIQWIAYVLKKVGRGEDAAAGPSAIDSECVSNIRYQIRLTLLKFFERVKDLDRDEMVSGSTMDNNEYVSRFLAAAAKILEPDEGQDFSICADIVEILQRAGSTIYGYQAALVFCHAIFAKARSMTPSLRQLVGALQKFDEELEEGLTEHLPSHFPKVSWGEFLQKAKDLGMEEIEVSSRDSKFYTPSERSFDRNSYCVVNVVPPTPTGPFLGTV